MGVSPRRMNRADRETRNATPEGGCVYSRPTTTETEPAIPPATRSCIGRRRTRDGGVDDAMSSPASDSRRASSTLSFPRVSSSLLLLRVILLRVVILLFASTSIVPGLFVSLLVATPILDGSHRHGAASAPPPPRPPPSRRGVPPPRGRAPPPPPSRRGGTRSSSSSSSSSSSHRGARGYDDDRERCRAPSRSTRGATRWDGTASSSSSSSSRPKGARSARPPGGGMIAPLGTRGGTFGRFIVVEERDGRNLRRPPPILCRAIARCTACTPTPSKNNIQPNGVEGFRRSVGLNPMKILSPIFLRAN
jgi:hypothetical protein